MFSWQVKKEAFCKSDAKKIWNVSTQFSRLHEWDPTVEWCKLFGPVKAGTEGEFKMYGRSPMKFKILIGEEGRLYKDESKIFGATVSFTHELLPSGKGTKIIHIFTVSGILAPLYKLVMYKSLNTSMQTALNNLVTMVEKESRTKE